MKTLRIIRIFKLGLVESDLLKHINQVNFLAKHSTGLQALGNTMKANYKELGLLFLLLGMGAIMFASLIFVFEKEEEKTTFHTMFDSYWWAIITMTTVSVQSSPVSGDQLSQGPECIVAFKVTFWLFLHVCISQVTVVQIVWPQHATLKMTAQNLSPLSLAMPC